MLYIIATPIGNLKDITERAIETLRGVDFILCEDTLHSKKLLNHYNIQTPLISYHQHSKLAKVDYVGSLLKENKNLALITDAGTPNISDPGGKLIEEVLKSLPDVEVIPIPGPCALTTALSASGMPADKFLFLGFPPAKKGRNKFFSEVLSSKHTVVFYESCHRILRTLKELSSFVNTSKELSSFHSPEVVVCRELTKKFEIIYRGTLEDVQEQIKKDAPGDKPKGEFVVLLNNYR
ncbi:16S rRNA (cytidine(1402)-2'-O)-methyltransferase [bacterium (Candidatus Gribaldobacteria) CG23_combo_of_CG06-09_8_20_14_all_37_87_8]|uniref:Ribosomal RNA small subunit methyltransferase I n=2 Tax=Candidatus Gribaldobacteria TaxID=2798536 RepID=A0A2G9ZEV1_9BACT|nr:MAG: 16S rRNA (cytidine(1402)-2'-O)-methyltransferase [Parcubacteria group bacterium CG1_02_37_13]PIP31709.1 MAG: 16S rRNA (cytidine(1402)-2'-O)-methyltransferase [bacterium (Candidatus Gribaldobacteria) CG23_combo_of_CG06-09_8_20_14_all_37_87_8]PIR90002.1 MAG: 16S rRNA (cytidine(1402)-2'-O)-methyltransferase [bacterium (Candidatus Gribaldobacteria) CG10_big_fil_rev_8_21_14_0_10_37_21]